MDIKEKIRQVADILLESDYTVALTGAGVSTESGIPDFRSPGSGLWTRVNPELFTIQGFKADPAQFYNLGRDFFMTIVDAKPGQAHTSLGELQRRGLLKTIITQNVDGLHQKAGALKVIEIHGNLRSASCIYCRRSVPMETVIEEVLDGLVPPLCVECGEPVKPDVILFGEPMPEAYGKALDEARQADCIMVIGSSMQVSPANMIPGLTGKLVIINREPTFFDRQACVAINDEIAPVMGELLLEINRRS